MSTIRRLLSESAEGWRISPRLARYLFWVPIIGVALVAISRLHKDTYRFLLVENGPIEWLQFLLFLAAAVGGVVVTASLWRRAHRAPALLWAAFALAALFIAGEEIAWGQQVFHWDTPGPLAEINKQGETTIHNIGTVQRLFNATMLLVGAYGGLACLIRGHRAAAAGLSWLFVPPFFLSSAFWILFAYKLVRLTLWRESGFTVTKFGEWSELCLAFGLAVFAFLCARRLREPAMAESPVAVPALELTEPEKEAARAAAS